MPPSSSAAPRAGRVSARSKQRGVLVRVCSAAIASTVALATAEFDTARTLERQHNSLCGSIAAFSTRLKQYCNAPAATEGAEGQLPVPGAELLHAQVVFRHGDRSAIHVLPGTERIQWLCGRPTHEHVGWAANLLRPRFSTAECVVDGDCVPEEVPTSEMPPRVQQAMHAWSQTRETLEPCGPSGGELSTIGWEQLESIGEALARRYKELFVRNTPGTTAIRVTTTDTGRTALSATAFLRGFLSGAVGTHALGVEAPPTDADVGLDDIPQLQLPLTLHVLSRQRDPLMYGMQSFVCPYARAYETQNARTVFRFAELPEEMLRRIAAVSGVPFEELPRSEFVVDDIFTRLCHGQTLPCWATEAERDMEVSAQGATASPDASASSISTVDDMCAATADYPPARALYFSAAMPSRNGSCLTAWDAMDAISQGDLYYATRFSTKSTELLLYPLFEQVSQLFHNAINQTRLAPRILVRAAHDTVLSPLLTVLGLRNRLYSWPGYAHRVVFELWRVPFGTLRRAHAAAQQVLIEDPGYMVRFVYQGTDITPQAPCAENFVTPEGGSLSLCSLAAFEAMVRRMLHLVDTDGIGGQASHPSWEARCHAPLEGGPSDVASGSVLYDQEAAEIPLQHTHATRITG